MSTNDLEDFLPSPSAPFPSAHTENGDCLACVEEMKETMVRFNAAQAVNSSWAHLGGKVYRPCVETVSAIPAGYYEVDQNEAGLILRQKDTVFDDLITLPDSTATKVIENITMFWEKEAEFRKYGFCWKRGALMYGPPGSGKTSAVHLICKNLIENDGIAFIIGSPLISAMGLSLIRKIEPTRHIVAIIEDLDAMAEKYGEAELLALLDGELQIDNVVFLATTNYPEKLDDRIKNRPSRFDLVMEIGMPTADARKLYLESKFPQFFNGTGEKVKTWVSATEGLSIAHLKELFLSVVVFGNSFEETINRLKGMALNNINSSKYNTLKKKTNEISVGRNYI